MIAAIRPPFVVLAAVALSTSLAGCDSEARDPLALSADCNLVLPGGGEAPCEGAYTRWTERPPGSLPPREGLPPRISARTFPDESDPMAACRGDGEAQGLLATRPWAVMEDALLEVADVAAPFFEDQCAYITYVCLFRVCAALKGRAVQGTYEVDAMGRVRFRGDVDGLELEARLGDGGLRIPSGFDGKSGRGRLRLEGIGARGQLADVGVVTIEDARGSLLALHVRLDRGASWEGPFGLRAVQVENGVRLGVRRPSLGLEPGDTGKVDVPGPNGFTLLIDVCGEAEAVALTMLAFEGDELGAPTPRNSPPAAEAEAEAAEEITAPQDDGTLEALP